MTNRFFLEARRRDSDSFKRTACRWNILELCSSAVFQFPEIYTLRVGAYLKEKGHRVTGGFPAGTPLAGKWEERKMPLTALDGHPGLWGIKKVWQLAQWIRRHHVDIVHVHRLRDVPLAVAAKKLAGSGKVILSLHTEGAVQSPYWVRHWVWNQLDGLVVPTRRLEIVAKRSFPLDPRRIFLNPYGVDIRKLYPNKILREVWREHLGISSGEVVIGTMGPLDPRFGHHLFLEAASRLLRRLPDLRFVILSQGEPQSPAYGKRWNRQADRLGIRERLHFVGPVRELFAAANMLDLYVQPTSSEPLCLALLEIMACEVVPVGVNEGSVPEVIEHNRNGLLVPPDQAPALAAAMFKLAGDAGKRNRLAREARRTVETRFRLESHLEKLERLFEEIWKN